MMQAIVNLNTDVLQSIQKQLTVVKLMRNPYSDVSAHQQLQQPSWQRRVTFGIGLLLQEAIAPTAQCTHLRQSIAQLSMLLPRLQRMLSLRGDLHLSFVLKSLQIFKRHNIMFLHVVAEHPTLLQLLSNLQQCSTALTRKCYI